MLSDDPYASSSRPGSWLACAQLRLDSIVVAIHRAVAIMLFILGSLFAVPSVQASDGVLEINQTCAVKSGCFAGDTSGFPIRISGTAGHGYRLTEGVPAARHESMGITVMGNDISLDLGGFSIVRFACQPPVARGLPVWGAGTGIDDGFTSIHGTSVADGRITGMGSFGLALGAQAVVTRVRVRGNGTDRIDVRAVVGDRALVHHRAWRHAHESPSDVALPRLSIFGLAFE